MSKAAQIKLVENLAGELKGTGVAALAFDPGLVEEGMTRAHFERGRTGDPWADGVLAFAEEAKRAGKLGSAEAAAAQLIRLVAGEADARSGRYLTVEDLA